MGDILKKQNENNKKLEVGDEAPTFTLPDQNGSNLDLKNLVGKKAIVLFFYPKDGSPGCTAEACKFRDEYDVFKERGADVIGISSDSIESHKKFEQKYGLPFTILSDKSGAVRKLYGVTSTLGILPGRVTYVIDRNGMIRYIFSSQTNAKAHVDKSLEILLEMDAEDKDKKPLEIKF